MRCFSYAKQGLNRNSKFYCVLSSIFNLLVTHPRVLVVLKSITITGPEAKSYASSCHEPTRVGLSKTIGRTGIKTVWTGQSRLENRLERFGSRICAHALGFRSKPNQTKKYIINSFVLLLLVVTIYNILPTLNKKHSTYK